VTRFLRGALAVVVSAVLVGGCSSSGPQPAELKPFKARVTPKVAWKASVGESGPYVFSPALHDGDFFVAGVEGRLQRLSGQKGRVVWKRDIGKDVTLSGGVAAGPGLVLVATSKGEVLAFDPADGRPKWSARVSTEVLARPVITEKVVVVRSGDSRIVGLDATDGSRRWEYIPTQQSALLIRGAFGATVEGDAVYAGLPGGKLVALRLENGSTLWEIPIATPKGDTELERVIDVVTEPVVRDGQVCAVAYQGRVGCFDAGRGTTAWARDGSSVTDMAQTGSAFFFADDAGTLYAVDRTAGASLWKQNLLRNRRLGNPAVVGRYVVVGDFEGQVHLFDQEDGQIAGRIATDGGPITAAPLAIGDRNFVVLTREGTLYALTLR
jgi:outer membrane protein assembly factor BamB